jgi:hypothetical protein
MNINIYQVICREGSAKPLSEKLVAGKIAAIKWAKQVFADTEGTEVTVFDCGREIEFVGDFPWIDAIEVSHNGKAILTLERKERE